MSLKWTSLKGLLLPLDTVATFLTSFDLNSTRNLESSCLPVSPVPKMLSVVSSSTRTAELRSSLSVFIQLKQLELLLVLANPKWNPACSSKRLPATVGSENRSNVSESDTGKDFCLTIWFLNPHEIISLLIQWFWIFYRIYGHKHISHCQATLQPPKVCKKQIQSFEMVQEGRHKSTKM